MTIDRAAWRAHLDDPEAVCRRAIGAALRRVPAAHSVGDVEVGVLLTDDDRVRQLNATYRDRDRPTNVLSFPALDRIPNGPRDDDVGVPVLLGDIALALETVLAEASASGTPLADHVSHLVIHGCLHLLGYDHHGDDEAARMERLETRILADLGIADPYGMVPVGAAGEPVAEARR